MSTIPPFAPRPNETPEEHEDEQQPDPFGDKTDREGGQPDPAEEPVEHPEEPGRQG